MVFTKGVWLATLYKLDATNQVVGSGNAVWHKMKNNDSVEDFEHHVVASPDGSS